MATYLPTPAHVSDTYVTGRGAAWFAFAMTLALMLAYSLRLSAVAVLAVAAYGVLRWTLMRALRASTEEALVHEARQLRQGARPVRRFLLQVQEK